MPLQSSSYFVKKQGSGSAKRNLETGAGSAFFQGRIAWALDGLKADPSGITSSLAIGEVASALICGGALDWIDVGSFSQARGAHADSALRELNERHPCLELKLERQLDRTRSADLIERVRALPK